MKKLFAKMMMVLSCVLFLGLMTVPAQAASKYYCRDNVLYSPSGKKLKKLPVSGDCSFWPNTEYYKGKVYLTKGSFDKWKYWTYLYDTKTKKLSCVLSGARINARYGKYVTTQEEYRTDVGAYPISLYRITGSGKLRKVKNLTGNGTQPVFSGGKLYFASYSKLMRTVAVWRCNADGSNKRQICKFKANNDSMVLVSQITPKTCNLYLNGKNYRYTYATKNYKRIYY